ncbi:hypothetical protein D910_05919, partial [Dendroctonus ponderosae]
VLANSDVKNSVNTFQLSKKYVKRLVKISILNIIYQRIAISEKEFEVKKYEKIPYRVFKPKSQNTFIRVYHAVTNGIIEAIDKDYLKEIVIHIVGKDNYDPLETYNIKIKYNKQDSKSNQKSSAVKAATMEYFKALTEIPGNKWQEDNVKVFFELSYNEACHGYISIEAVDKTKFSCYSCSCPRADKNKLDKLNMLMKTRAIIYGIQLEKSIPCEMQLATKDEAAYILDQLDSLGVIDCSSSSFSKINEKSLSSAILATFNFEDSQYLA